MSLDKALAALKHPYWPDAPEEMGKLRQSLTLSKSDRDYLIDRAQNWLLKGKEGRATNFLYAGFILGGVEFQQRLQQSGILRLSRTEFENRTLVNAVKALTKSELGFSDGLRMYLSSVRYLFEIASQLRVAYEELAQWLKNEREVALKGLLAVLDALFMVKAQRGYEIDKHHLTSAESGFFSPEQLAEGFSTVLAAYNNLIGPPAKNFPINRTTASDGIYDSFLKTAAHLAAYREWEVLIDRFGYYLIRKDSQKIYELIPPSAEFERSIRLGFIQTQSQTIARGMEILETTTTPSIREVAEKFWTHFGDDLISIQRTPIERYVFAIPDVSTLWEKFRTVELFREEQMALFQASLNLLTPPDKLLAVKLHRDLTVLDFFQIRRFFDLFRWQAVKQFVPLLNTEYSLVLQSIIPNYTPDILKKIFSHAVGQDKVNSFIELLSMRFGTGTHLDVQYQPLIPIGNDHWLAINVLSNSNILRNTLALTRKRLYPDGRDDPLPTAIAEALKSRGHFASASLKYDFEGKTGDVDVFVIIGEFCFAFECKNSLLPTGPHELLTSFDYIQSATEQLDRFSLCFKDARFRQWLSRNCKIAIPNTAQLATGIIMSNRMFMGLRLGNHPIRGCHELLHFVNEGTISLGDEQHCFWHGKSMSGDDLVRYLRDDITYRPLWDAMTPFFEHYTFGGLEILQPAYRLDLLSLARVLGFKKAEKAIQDTLASE